MPLRMPWSTCRVMTLPSRVTIQAFDDEPSVTWPLLSTNQASLAPCSRAACLASTLGNSAVVLMSTRGQRFSGNVITLMPRAALSRPLAGSRLRAVTTTAGLTDSSLAPSRSVRILPSASITTMAAPSPITHR